MIVDLHSHLVPGVDDGATSVGDALLALQGLAAEHVTRVVTTPHLLAPFLASPADVARELDRHRRAFDELAAAASRSTGPLPEIRLGQEIWAPDAATLKRILSAPGLGLGGAKRLCNEFAIDSRSGHGTRVMIARWA